MCITDAILELELDTDIQLYDESSRQIVILAKSAMNH